MKINFSTMLSRVLPGQAYPESVSFSVDTETSESGDNLAGVIGDSLADKEQTLVRNFNKGYKTLNFTSDSGNLITLTISLKPTISEILSDSDNKARIGNCAESIINS